MLYFHKELKSDYQIQKCNIIWNGKENIYNVPISKKPYTALCVDVFTEEETKEGISVIKYINEEGLGGKYSIYIEVDGTIYNTNKYVEF